MTRILYTNSPAPATAERLRECARDVRRLLPSRQDPEAFHVSKDEIAKALLRLAREFEGGR